MSILASVPLLSLALYGVLGFFAGIMAGLFGVGGGLIIVPALAWMFHSQGIDEAVVMHLAIGSSLATIVVTSFGSMRAHNKHHTIAWEVFTSLSPGIVSGALLGACLASLLTTLWLQKFVAIFIILVAMQLLLNPVIKASQGFPGAIIMFFSGGIIGLVSAMAGIGGGSLTVPYLLRHRIPMVTAIGTASACGLPIALAGAVGFIITGLAPSASVPMTTGYLNWPAIIAISAVSYLSAPIGVWLAHKLPVQTLKKLFALMLILIGWYFFQR